MASSVSPSAVAQTTQSQPVSSAQEAPSSNPETQPATATVFQTVLVSPSPAPVPASQPASSAPVVLQSQAPSPAPQQQPQTTQAPAPVPASSRVAPAQTTAQAQPAPQNEAPVSSSQPPAAVANSPSSQILVASSAPNANTPVQVASSAPPLPPTAILTDSTSFPAPTSSSLLVVAMSAVPTTMLSLTSTSSSSATALGSAPTSTSSSAPSSPVPVAAIGGAIVGVIVALALVGLGVFLFTRRRALLAKEAEEKEQKTVRKPSLGSSNSPSSSLYDVPATNIVIREKEKGMDIVTRDLGFVPPTGDIKQPVRSFSRPGVSPSPQPNMRGMPRPYSPAMSAGYRSGQSPPPSYTSHQPGPRYVPTLSASFPQPSPAAVPRGPLPSWRDASATRFSNSQAPQPHQIGVAVSALPSIDAPYRPVSPVSPVHERAPSLGVLSAVSASSPTGSISMPNQYMAPLDAIGRSSSAGRARGMSPLMSRQNRPAPSMQNLGSVDIGRAVSPSMPCPPLSDIGQSRAFSQSRAGVRRSTLSVFPTDRSKELGERLARMRQ